MKPDTEMRLGIGIAVVASAAVFLIATLEDLRFLPIVIIGAAAVFIGVLVTLRGYIRGG